MHESRPIKGGRVPILVWTRILTPTAWRRLHLLLKDLGFQPAPTQGQRRAHRAGFGRCFIAAQTGSLRFAFEQWRGPGRGPKRVAEASCVADTERAGTLPVPAGGGPGGSRRNGEARPAPVVSSSPARFELPCAPLGSGTDPREGRPLVSRLCVSVTLRLPI